MKRSWLFFVASLVAYDLVWIWQVVVLPTRVPLHWDAEGTPRVFGSRTEALAQSALLGLTAVAVFVLLALVASRLPGRDALLRNRLMDGVWAAGAVTLAYLTATEIVALPDLRLPTAQMSVRFDLAAALYVLALAAVLMAAARHLRRAAGPLD